MDTPDTTIPVRVNYVLNGPDGQPLADKGVPLTVGKALQDIALAPPPTGNYSPEGHMERWRFVRGLSAFQKTAGKRNAVFPVDPNFLRELADDIARIYPTLIAGQLLALLERWANPQLPTVQLTKPPEQSEAPDSEE